MFLNIIINKASILTGCNHPPKALDLLIRCLAKSLFTTSRLIAEDQLLVNRDTTFLLWLIKCHSPRALGSRGLVLSSLWPQNPGTSTVCLPVTWPSLPLATPRAGLPRAAMDEVGVATEWPHGLVCVPPRSSSGSHFRGTWLCSKSQWQMVGAHSRECEGL